MSLSLSLYIYIYAHTPTKIRGARTQKTWEGPKGRVGTRMRVCRWHSLTSFVFTSCKTSHAIQGQHFLAMHVHTHTRTDTR